MAVPCQRPVEFTDGAIVVERLHQRRAGFDETALPGTKRSLLLRREQQTVTRACLKEVLRVIMSLVVAALAFDCFI